jgi:hypothetical protein
MSEPKTLEPSWREHITRAKKESKALRLRSEKERKRKKQGPRQTLLRDRRRRQPVAGAKL